MNITVNDEAVMIDENTSVAKLLELRDVTMPDMVTVHLNREIVDRQELDQTILHEGDEVEFVFFMGGGF